MGSALREANTFFGEVWLVILQIICSLLTFILIHDQWKYIQIAHHKQLKRGASGGHVRAKSSKQTDSKAGQTNLASPETPRTSMKSVSNEATTELSTSPSPRGKSDIESTYPSHEENQADPSKSGHVSNGSTRNLSTNDGPKHCLISFHCIRNVAMLDKLILMTGVFAFLFFVAGIFLFMHSLILDGADDKTRVCGYSNYIAFYLFGYFYLFYFSTLIYRSHVSFRDSAYAYNKYMLMGFEVICIGIYGVITTVGVPIWVSMEWKTCDSTTHFIGAVLLGGGQLILTIISLALFIIPLLKIIKLTGNDLPQSPRSVSSHASTSSFNSGKSASDRRMTRFRYLVVKDGIIVGSSGIFSLVAIAVFSQLNNVTITRLSMLFSIYGLMALYSRHDSRYMKVCGYFHNKFM